MDNRLPEFDSTIADFYHRAPDERRRAGLLQVARVFESEPSVIGISAHLLLVGRKRSATPA